MLRRGLFLVLLLTCVVLAARVADRYSVQVDLSAQRINSLTTVAQRALDQIGPRLELLAFVPDFAVQRAEFQRLLAPYLAHRPDLQITYIDPVAQPERAREHGATRQGELHLLAAPRREVISEPTRSHIDRALNRLALQGERWIVMLKGHGEREIDGSPNGLDRLAAQTEALGYRVITLDPRQIESLPDNTAVLLLAGPQRPYDARSRALIGAFLDNGGRLLWLTGTGSDPILAAQFGLTALPGTVVDANAARYGLDDPANAIVDDFDVKLLPQPPDRHSVLHRARAFDFTTANDWQLVAQLRSSQRSWNETGDLKGRLRRDPESGEAQGPLSVGVALQRSSGQPSARAVILGSAHLLGNAQIGQAANLELTLGLIHWLSDNPLLIAQAPGASLQIDWSPELAATLAVGLMGVLPTAYLLTGLWLRRRRRRA